MFSCPCYMEWKSATLTIREKESYFSFGADKAIASVNGVLLIIGSIKRSNTANNVSHEKVTYWVQSFLQSMNLLDP